MTDGTSQKGNSLPLVSIVMCTYNGDGFALQQLESLKNQSYRHLEIIISDDASESKFQNILKEQAKQDDRIKLHINRENKGFTLNFSDACQYATGEYIAFCDQDDIWHKQKIEKMMAAWPSGIPLLYCNSVRFTNESELDTLSENKRYRRFEGTDLRKIAIFNTVSGHAMMVKKDFLPHLLPFREGLMYDWWSAAVAACHGGVGYLNEILVYQRVHGTNISMGKGFSHLDPQYKGMFLDMVGRHIEAFSKIAEPGNRYKYFFQSLSKKWHRTPGQKFNFDLFLFLLKYRSIVFWYKKRKFALFSHVKHSFKLSGN